MEDEIDNGGRVFPKLRFVILSLMVLAACTQPSPELPELTPQTACQSASQCIWAVRLDRCCDCGGIYNLEQVESDPRLLFLSQNDEYDYPVERIPPPPDCGEVVCAPCMEPPIGLVCDGGNCRRAQTAAEILSLCPAVVEPHRREWCPVTAAVAALNQQGLPEAVEICNQISGRGMDGLPLRETCILNLAREFLSAYPALADPSDPWKSVDLCRAELTLLQGTCLYESAQVISQVEFEPALQVCESIPVEDEGNLWQRSACFDYLAYIIAPSDLDQAVSLCERAMDLEPSCLDKIRTQR
jgi:hypothetical protein